MHVEIHFDFGDVTSLAVIILIRKTKGIHQSFQANIRKRTNTSFLVTFLNLCKVRINNQLYI